MLRIGRVQLATPVMLAPVAGHCDLPFRLAARSCGGVGLAFTDLLCPHGVLKQNRQTQWLMATDHADQPLGMQLYGSDPDMMAEAARWAVDAGATTIDINMGCPVDKVTKTFAGSMMLCTPDATVAVAERLVRTVGDQVPVTAKLRLGYHFGELTAPALARRLIRCGISAITIHGRTAELRFKGTVDLGGIAAVVHAVHEEGRGEVPCIGNGDIRTPFDARNMIDKTSCDGVMIARVALTAPWILRDTAHYLAHGVLPAEFTLRERLGVIRHHFEMLTRLREPRYALSRIKQKIGPYGTFLGPCKSLKAAVAAMQCPDAFGQLADAFLDAAGDAADAVPVTWAARHAIFARDHRQTCAIEPAGTHAGA